MFAYHHFVPFFGVRDPAVSANQMLKKLITPDDDGDIAVAGGLTHLSSHMKKLYNFFILLLETDSFQLAPVLSVLTHQLIYQVYK